MKIEVSGYRFCQFTDDKGNEVKGTSVYFLKEADGVIGVVQDKFFIKDVVEQAKLPANFRVGAKIDVEYGPRGRVVDYKVIG